MPEQVKTAGREFLLECHGESPQTDDKRQWRRSEKLKNPPDETRREIVRKAFPLSREKNKYCFYPPPQGGVDGGGSDKELLVGSKQSNAPEVDNNRTWVATSLLDIVYTKDLYGRTLRCVALHKSYPKESQEVQVRLDVKSPSCPVAPPVTNHNPSVHNPVVHKTAGMLPMGVTPLLINN
ncbi:hypothetical protein RUM44_007248 [Polyplax serrata]|uniref:Uncharacterized protein n=1 Tax=Polyplax serrata TaxID=468196 RepID=A0ABR1B053_POLSC